MSIFSVVYVIYVMMNVILIMPILYFCLLQTVFMLLKSKSEQERRLLTALVNKVSYATLSYLSSFFNSIYEELL
jgi:hypothetical protein